MATKYLDNTGLAYFWGKIKSYIAGLLVGKADDSAVVHKTGNESVSGTKTFSSQIAGTIGKSHTGYVDMLQTYQSDNGNYRSCTIRCTNGNGYNEILIGAHDESDGNPMGLVIRNTDGSLETKLSGALRLTRPNDASGTADNAPALTVGPVSGEHLELDGNEIMAKASGTTTGPLFINLDGGDVYIGGAGANYKSVTGRGRGSSTIPVYTDANGIVTACGSSLDVDISGSAATASAFSSSKAVTLTGAVTGTASSTGGWTVPTLWRYCQLGRSDSGTSNPWYKVASRSLENGNSTYSIAFFVENCNTASKFSGILHVSVSTGSSKTIFSANTAFRWVANNGFSPEDFVLVCPDTASPTVEIWARFAAGYLRRRFTVVSEGTQNSASIGWTLYSGTSAGQEASIPTAGTQVVSSASLLEQRVKALEDAAR